MESSRILSLDEIRTLIDEYGKRAANLRDQKGKEIALLELRDTIHNSLMYYRERGAYLDSEDTRLGNHDMVLKGKAHSLVRMGGATEFARARSRLSPETGQWWWWLDKKVAEKNRQNRKKNFLTLSTVVGILLVLYFGIFRLPPDEREYYDTMNAIETISEEFTVSASRTEQLALLEEAYALTKKMQELFPERYPSYLIAGVVLEKKEDTEKAHDYYHQARALIGSEPDFLVEQAYWYLHLDSGENALLVLNEVVDTYPDHLAAWNLLGTIHEVEQRIPQAMQAYERVLELAEEQNAVSLIPITRMKIAMLQMQLPAFSFNNE